MPPRGTTRLAVIDPPVRSRLGPLMVPVSWGNGRFSVLRRSG